MKTFKIVAGLLVVVLIFGVVIAYFAGAKIPGLPHREPVVVTAEPDARLKVELAKDMPHTVIVPEEVRQSLHIRVGGKDQSAVAELPKGRRPLVLSASTMFNPASLYRIRVRFTPADVVRIEKISVPGENGTKLRELAAGDEVKEKTILGELYSVDLGAKKNDLIDALVALKNDKEILENAEASAAGVPRALMITFEKAVQGDINTIERALRYLQAWKIPPDEIKEVYDEADRIFLDRKRRDLTFRPYDLDKPDKWGKVMLRAPFDAVIVERNVSEKETLLDPTVNLFQLAKVDKLQVLANAPEERVKELYQIWRDHGLQWTIRTLGEPESDGITAPIDEIAYLADPNTHTIPIKGTIPNKDKVLRAGQYVTATIQLPPPKDVVEIPASAVVDDGKQTVVFIQHDENKPQYTMRRVMVTHRYDNKVFVRSWLSEQEQKLTPEEQDAGLMPKKPLLLGERVLTAGILELKKELEDREADKVD
jgi:membrane fusion protein, heavy metal efflux system